MECDEFQAKVDASIEKLRNRDLNEIPAVQDLIERIRAKRKAAIEKGDIEVATPWYLKD